MTAKQQQISFWAARLVAAFLLLQTLYFKFSASEESVYIFSTLGMEPWGRIGSGVLELIASILLLLPATTGWGALLAMGVMSGAVGAHLLTPLGVNVKDDHGQLFIYALIVFFCSLYLLWNHRRQIPVLKNI